MVMPTKSELQQRVDQLEETIRGYRRAEDRARRDALAARRALHDLIERSRQLGILLETGRTGRERKGATEP